MKIQKKVIFALSFLLLVLVSLGLGFIYIKTQLDLVFVSVASHDLKARTLITEEDLKTIEVPRVYLTEQVLLDADQIIGKYVVLDGFIPDGSLIYQQMTENLSDAIDSPSLLLKENQAVYTLDMNLVSSAGNTLKIGQRIDLYGTLKENRNTLVDLLLSQVRIVGLKDKNGIDVDGNSKLLPKVMLLALDRIAVPYLTKLNALGEITISPTSYELNEDECLLHTDTALWDHLYVQ